MKCCWRRADWGEIIVKWDERSFSFHLLQHTFLGTGCELGNSNSCSVGYQKRSKNNQWQNDIRLVLYYVGIKSESIFIYEILFCSSLFIFSCFHEIRLESATTKFALIRLSYHQLYSTGNTRKSFHQLPFNGRKT